MRYALIVACVAALGYVAGYLTGHPGSDAGTVEGTAAGEPRELVRPAEASMAPAVTTMANAVPGEAPEMDAVWPDSGPATLADILRIPGDFKQTAALYRLLARTGGDELERLLAEVPGLTQDSERRAVLSIAYARYADINAAAALAHSLAGDPAYLELALGSIYHSWSRADLSAALASLAVLEPWQKTIGGLALLRARDDLAEAERLQIAQDLGIEANFRQLELQRQHSLAGVDPWTAWDTALAVPGQQLRSQSLLRVAAQWAGRDPLAALDAVAGIADVRLRSTLEQVVLQQWGQHEPEAALVWALDLPSSNARRNAVGGALSLLAAVDPEAAISYYDSMSDADRRAALGKLLTGWAAQDPGSAARWWSSLEPGAGRGEGYSLAMRYAQTDAGEAFDWALSLPVQQAAMAIQAVLMTVARQDPRTAVTMVARVDDPVIRQGAAAGLVQSWARNDPEAAWRWVRGVESDGQRKQLQRQLMHTWAQEDRNAALNQVRRIADAAERDRIAADLIGLFMNDIDTVERIYRSIESKSVRRQAAEQLYHRLKDTDPVRAERYRAGS